MSDVWFPEDVSTRLTALAQANARALTLARRYGMDREAAKLCQAVYAGALLDVATSFGLAATMLIISQREGVMSDGRAGGRDDAALELPELATTGDAAAAGEGHRRGRR